MNRKEDDPGFESLSTSTLVSKSLFGGLLMGLAYGGALIIQMFRAQSFDPRARFMALACLSLLHGVIEDTALMLAIGADIWIILIGRIVFTLAVIAVLARIVARLPALAEPKTLT